MPYSVGSLDNENLARAWERAHVFASREDDTIGKVSDAELPLLRLMEACMFINRQLGEKA